MCLIDGAKDLEIARKLGVNAASLRPQVANKMMNEPGLEETLGGVRRLPFTAEDGLAKTEAMVYSLKCIGFKQVEIAEVLRLDSSNVGTHLKRARVKILGKKDRDVPDLKFEEVEISQPLGLVKAIHWVVGNRLENSEIVDLEANLSRNESAASLWRCTGRTEAQIAIEMDTSPGTVQTYLKRASKKLGVRSRYQLIARTLIEITRQ